MTRLTTQGSLTTRCTAAFLLFFASSIALSQQTVFNVPSADVLDRGKMYMEWDASLGDSSLSGSFTPRSSNGLGHGVEAGVGVSSFNFPDAGEVVVTPTVKWKFFESTAHGLVLFGGEQVFLPIKRRTYGIGSNAYVEAAKSTRFGTRVGVGIYDFTSQTIDRANRAGVQASIEQTVNARLSLAADWYSGNTSIGFTNLGAGWKLTRSVSVMGGFGLGNHGLMEGNHQILLTVGWNSEFSHGREAR
jgi:hypothetical protein